MNSGKLIINGHFRPKRVTGVERYAWEIISQFDKQNIPYNWVQPPGNLRSDTLRQLWIQSVMPFKIPDDAILWSPTNAGPIFCKNQVLTLHDIADQLHPEWFDDKYIAWRRFILPRLLRKVRGIVTVSEFSRQSILKHFPEAEGRIEVVHNGVRSNHFYPRSEAEKKKMRSKFNLEKPFVLSVGSLDPRKNVQRLIKAWHLLPGWFRKEMNLVITGESARKFAFKLDEMYDESVRFTGYVQDKQLPVLYSAARVFVYPSLFEGFGLPVIEAMACGTSVITSNTSALKEISGPAATVNPESVEEIRSTLRVLINDSAERLKMERKGIDWAARFTWKQSAEETYKSIMKAVTV